MLKLVNVSKYYSSEGNVALGLRNINIEFKENEIVAIVGESGSGKTTLLNVISGIDSYEEGEMYLNGSETSYFSVADWENYRKNNIGFVFQNYNIIDSYSVVQNVETVLLLQGLSKKEARKKALDIIEKVGLTKRKNAKASKLSGGEKQRTVIARAIASDAKILVCDEPTGNLDSESGKQIMALINEVSKGRLVIVVTHDFNIIEPYATRRVRLFDGEVVEDVSLKKIKDSKLDSEEKVRAKSPLFLNFLFAIRNLLTTPKRTTLSFLVYLVLSFFIAGLYESVFVSNTETWYPNYYYNFTSENRVVVNKKDKSSFSEQELDKIRNVANVEIIYENDFYLDYFIYISFNESKFFEMPYAYQSINVLKGSDLLIGSLPASNDEVVVSYRDNVPLEEIVDQTFEIRNKQYKIVGITNKNYSKNEYVGAIFAGEELKNDIIYSNFSNLGLKIFAKSTLQDLQIVSFIVDDSMEDGKVILSYHNNEIIDFNSENTKITVKHFYGEDDLVVDELIAINVPVSGNSIQFNSNTLAKLFDLKTYQLTVMVKDTYLINNTIDSLNNLDYVTYAPSYDKAVDLYAFTSLLGSILSTIFAFFAIIVLYFISYLVLSFIVNSKKKDYAILRILGANKNYLNNIVIFENIILAISSYIMLIILVLVLGNYYELAIFKVLQYNEFNKMVILLIIITVLSFLISLRFNHKLFKSTANVGLKKD